MREDDNTRKVATFITSLLYAGMGHKRAIVYGYEFAYALLAGEAGAFEEGTGSPKIRSSLIMQAASHLLVDAVQGWLDPLATERRHT